MTGDYWLLDGHTPVKTDDVRTWGRMFEKMDRIVGRDTIRDATVSTVFLGIDHSLIFGGQHDQATWRYVVWDEAAGPPGLFETMIFGGEHDEYQERFRTWEEAEAGHKAACVLAGVTP